MTGYEMANSGSPAPGAMTGPPDILVEARGVTKQFEGLVANRDIDFDIPRHSIVSMIGPNGAGKTTFFNQLSGVYHPTSGTITLDGVDISNLPPHLVASLGVARTYQNIRLFKDMTVLANVSVGQHVRSHGAWYAAIFRFPGIRREEAAIEQKSFEMLERVGLRRRVADELAKNLPYGDQRRLEVARALASEPVLLLLDEPTAGMNPGETRQMTEFIAQLRKDLNLTILLIEHDMKVVMGVSERITVLDYGEKIAEGKPEEIRANQRVIEAYLGKQATA